MNDKHGATIAIQKRMSVSKQTHDYTRRFFQGHPVLSKLQALLYRSLRILRMTKKVSAFEMALLGVVFSLSWPANG